MDGVGQPILTAVGDREEGDSRRAAVVSAMALFQH